MAAPTRPDRPRVAVVGGGLAGLAAAVELVERGREVVLIERLRRAGGRAFSFTDRHTGLVLDNGQHVLLGCCAQVKALLARLGLADCVRFQSHLDVPVWCGGHRAHLASARLPGPLHLLPGMLRYAHLQPSARWRALRVARALRGRRNGGRTPGDAETGETFAAWLRRHGQDDLAVQRLWNLIGTAVLNCGAEQAGAGLACATLRLGFLGDRRAAALGLFVRPLGAIAARAVELLVRRGARVVLGCAATGLAIQDGAMRGVHLASGETVPADAVIAAVPPQALTALLPEAWRRDPVFAAAAALRWSPIYNLYLLFDRPVLTGDLAAFVGGSLQFAFNRGRLLGEPDLDGRLIALSVSAAGDLQGLPRDATVHRLAGELTASLPGASGARLLAAVPLWQRQATFLADPASAARRAPTRSPLGGLYLAGDWTDTGWPASLEGAVRSGLAAAELAGSAGAAGT